MFEQLIAKIRDIKEKELQVGTSRCVLSIQQTQRNNEKAELIEAFYEGLNDLANEMGVEVYITKEGPVIEIQNESVENQVSRMDEDDLCNGMISIQLDLKIKNLDYDAAEMEEQYLFDKREKEEKARAKAAEQRRKTERDAEVRAEKARLRQAKMEKYLQAESESKED